MIVWYMYPLFALFIVVTATRENGTAEEPNCLGTPLVLPEDMKKMRDDCFTQYNSTYDPHGIESKNITCIYVCFLKQIGLISVDNKILKDPLADILKKSAFPVEAIEPMVKEVGTCIDNKGSKFELTNEDCTTFYKNIMMDCGGKAFQKICMPKEQ